MKTDRNPAKLKLYNIKNLNHFHNNKKIRKSDVCSRKGGRQRACLQCEEEGGDLSGRLGEHAGDEEAHLTLIPRPLQLAQHLMISEQKSMIRYLCLKRQCHEQEKNIYFNVPATQIKRFLCPNQIKSHWSEDANRIVVS